MLSRTKTAQKLIHPARLAGIPTNVPICPIFCVTEGFDNVDLETIIATVANVAVTIHFVKPARTPIKTVFPIVAADLADKLMLSATAAPINGDESNG